MSSYSESDLSDVKDEKVPVTRELNIVLIGESGVGKSAIINQLLDQDIVKSSNQATGCTIDNAKVSGKLKDRPDLSLNLYDTAGLSESADGNVSTVKAFVQLIKLCYSIPNGINLLMFCHAKGRLSSEQFKTNYRIFKEELCENKIRCLLVITNCDNDEPLNSWWEENKNVIRNQLKFNFDDGVCVSTKRSRRNEPDTILEDYTKSRRDLIEAIEKYALTQPVKIDSWKRKIMVYMRTCYNSFRDWLSWLGLQRLSLRPELEQMFTDLKYSKDQARIEVDNLLEELKNDMMAPYKIVNADNF